jgi:hypothetical protein
MTTTTTRKAIIEWISAENGGRTNASSYGPDHAAPAKFLAYADTWFVEAWDLLVHRVNGEGISDRWEAEARFRMPQAPHQ